MFCCRPHHICGRCSAQSVVGMYVCCVWRIILYLVMHTFTAELIHAYHFIALSSPIFILELDMIVCIMEEGVAPFGQVNFNKAINEKIVCRCYCCVEVMRCERLVADNKQNIHTWDLTRRHIHAHGVFSPSVEHICSFVCLCVDCCLLTK